jgi:outer membrane receptor for Fe3+-dicitrate
VFLSGMDQLHHGAEVEATYKPIRYFAIGGFASLGNWKYTNNVTGIYKDYDNTGTEEDIKSYYVEGLKVGDAPQTQFGIIAAAYPVKNLRLQVDFRHNSNYYADWDPFSRTSETDRGQVWKTPSYYLVDLHASYRFDVIDKIDIEVFGHVFNVLNELYIQDATDNSNYNGYYGTEENPFSHDVNTAEVYVGLPRTFNAGVKVTF